MKTVTRFAYVLKKDDDYFNLNRVCWTNLENATLWGKNAIEKAVEVIKESKEFQIETLPKAIKVRVEITEIKGD